MQHLSASLTTMANTRTSRRRSYTWRAAATIRPSASASDPGRATAVPCGEAAIPTVYRAPIFTWLQLTSRRSVAGGGARRNLSVCRLAERACQCPVTLHSVKNWPGTPDPYPSAPASPSTALAVSAAMLPSGLRKVTAARYCGISANAVARTITGKTLPFGWGHFSRANLSSVSA